MKRNRLEVGLALAISILAGAGSVPASSEGEGKPVSPLRQGAVGGTRVELDGSLVSALAARPDELLLLVRPAGEPDGPRRLLRLTSSERFEIAELARELPGWIKTLAAIDLGSGPELLVGGLERVESLGDLAAPSASLRRLVAHPGFDLRSLHPDPLRKGVERELAAAEAGWLRVWRPDGAGGLGLAVESRLPLQVEREATGLEVTSPPVALLPGAEGGPGRAFCGPEARGARRLRVVEPGVEGEDGLSWLALPGVESVERAWLVAFDGAPALVVHAQGAARIDLFEEQRYRVFALGGGDRTRAGRAPGLAVEVDSKRWHDTSIAAADADGDGHDDLILVRPEGITGGDLVVQVFPGRGGVRFESRARRTDLDAGPDEWRIVTDPVDPDRPALATIGEGTLELWRFES
ncbi:MAG TPA: hypothetical protein VLA66_04370, partial [Thermoanaerobaculia bacterium]|nr:hypothetical protein [Thermoanaerobaculia bacterium]